MTETTSAKIEIVSFNDTGITELKTKYSKETLLLDFPTVYLIRTANSKKAKVYIGETTDIIQRTSQHLHNDPISMPKWSDMVAERDTKMVVIGHDHFNKSLTLDIENRLIDYMLGSKSVELINGRGNPQGQYFPSRERDKIFQDIWQQLHDKDSDLFPLESIIKDSALFKASPLKALTNTQETARKLIMTRVAFAMSQPDVGQLILVEGEAGSGKTVLLSRLFYDLMTTMSKKGVINDYIDSSATLDGYLLVNHDEQVKIYQQVMTKIGVSSPKDVHVSKPTSFINSTNPKNPVDVVLVDESHLLWTQGKQSYRGKNQLHDLLTRAKVVIAVFDPHQVLAGNEYVSPEQLQKMHQRVIESGNLIHLTQQMRVQADKPILDWLDNFIFSDQITPLPKKDSLGYDLRIFNSASDMYDELKKKAKDENLGISRMLATFDWPFKQKGSPENGDYWRVSIDDKFNLPWNKQLPIKTPNDYIKASQLSWAEQPQTICEIGSTFTIQGSDLNYAGVILGPSVKYRNGKVIHDVNGTANKNVKNKRTLNDGQKIDISEELLRNEVNVLLTRGVHGLFIYAVDPALRHALLAAQSGELVSTTYLPLLVADKQNNNYK